MEYAAMRDLLEELRAQLGGIFEHGLAGSGRLAEPLQALGHRLEEFGLEGGAALAETLGEELARSRLEARWDCGEAAALYRRLWRYAAQCTRRLEYLEAQHALDQAD